jgi:cation transport ATPase-like protein
MIIQRSSEVMKQPQGSDGIDEWHSSPVEDVVSRLDTDLGCGLALDKAEQRLARDGPNRLPPPVKRPGVGVLDEKIRS